MVKGWLSTYVINYLLCLNPISVPLVQKSMIFALIWNQKVSSRIGISFVRISHLFAIFRTHQYLPRWQREKWRHQRACPSVLPPSRALQLNRRPAQTQVSSCRLLSPAELNPHGYYYLVMVSTYTPWWFLLDTIFHFCHPMDTIKTIAFHLSTSWVLFGPWFSIFPECS